MKNKVLKCIVLAVSGFVVGAAAGAGITHAVEKKKSDKEMSETIEYYKEKTAKYEADIVKLCQDLNDAMTGAMFDKGSDGSAFKMETHNEGSVEIDKKNDPQKKKKKKNTPSEEDYVGYGAMYDSDKEEETKRSKAQNKAYKLAKEQAYMNENDEPDDEEPEYEDEDEEDLVQVGVKDSDDAPYQISATSFNDEFDYHDKITLRWYKKDRVLLDEQENIVDNIDRTVGYDNFDNNVVFDDDDPCYRFVRNEMVGADFEIIIEDGDFPGKEEFD